VTLKSDGQKGLYLIALLTGITGLVGCHTATSMAMAGHRVVALARSGEQGAQARVMQVMEHNPQWRAAGHRMANLLVVEGDLLRPSCGIKTDDVERLKGCVDVILHCAGEVQFVGGENDILRVNTDGVRNILQLAQVLHCPRLVHVSTAYLARKTSSDKFRTTYEKTKSDGEAILQAHQDAAGVKATILRPSIITGDQIHGFTPKLNGIYPFLRFAAEHWAILRSLPLKHWFQEAHHAAASVNLVPADVVAGAIRLLAEKPQGVSRILTLMNPDNWPVRDLVRVVSEHFSSASLMPPAGQDAADTWERQIAMFKKVYEPYAGVHLRIADDSGNALNELQGLPPFRNRDEWIHVLLTWCERQGWRELA
jgi:nucleoside-diphosphate-sugar epimerase